MTIRIFRLTPLALLAGSILGAPAVHAAPAAERVLEHTAGDVITRNYVRLAYATDRLAERLVDLQETPTAEGVIAARAAWREARAYWETGEAHLFGPVDTDGHDPAMDSWPLDQRELGQLVAGSVTLDAERVAALDGDVKGFHAVEFLLWHQPVAEGRESAERAAERLADQPRQRDLLAALGADLADHATAMAASWQGSDGHARQLAGAGTPASRLYPAVRGALQELAEGMDGIADELAAAKLGEPLASGRLDGVESPYARNTRADMQHNVEGIRNLWLGSLDGVDSGLGLRALAAANDAEVAAVDRALLVANGRLAAIGETDDGNARLAFAEAVAGGRQTQQARIQAAVEAVRDLQERLAQALGEEE
ncbi:MAG: imelysin family protein [Pseudomonadota bacterium]